MIRCDKCREEIGPQAPWTKRGGKAFHQACVPRGMNPSLALILAVAVSVITAAGGWGGYVYGAAKQREAFYTHNGSSEGCSPSDKWPCWKVDRNECLWFANSTAIVRYCTSARGGWNLCDPAANATYLPCNKGGA